MPAPPRRATSGARRASAVSPASGVGSKAHRTPTSRASELAPNALDYVPSGPRSSLRWATSAKLNMEEFPSGNHATLLIEQGGSSMR